MATRGLEGDLFNKYFSNVRLMPVFSDWAMTLGDDAAACAPEAKVLPRTYASEAAATCVDYGARLSARFQELCRKMQRVDSLAWAAVVGFGGDVAASVTGVLQGNAASSLIVATELSTVQLKNTKLMLNMGFTGTGVLMVDASTLHVNNSTLSNNLAVTFGGAVAAASGTFVEIVNSRFDYNIAAGGGALFASGHVTQAINTTFSANCAVGGVDDEWALDQQQGLLAYEGRGGAVWAVGGNHTTMANTTFLHNVAAAGSAINSMAGNLTLKGCLLKDNWASTYGGGLTVWKGLAGITGTVFVSNTAEVAGGAVALIPASVTVDNSSMQHNAGGQCGGGLFMTALFETTLVSTSWQADSSFNNVQQ
uniref:Right handed beta helix domain-containing protein n=2 Tax=Tetradesmus obliquus TaxID=3088 RepID=A0A383W4K8_TETOB|eukprot:jgi/Sobl393_1/1115/SZX72069.1